jgi:hypothetical protein
MADKEEEDGVGDAAVKAKEALETIAEFASAAKGSAATAEEARKLIEGALAEMQAKLAEMTATATLALTVKTQITDTQTVIASKSGHIQGAQEHADKIRAELDRALTAATQQANDVEGEKLRAKSAAEKAGESLAAVQAIRLSVDSDIASVSASRRTAEDVAAQIKSLVEQAAVDAQAKLSEIVKAATTAAAVNAQITTDQAVIATRSDHIQKAQEHADTIRASLDRELTAATQKKTEAEGFMTAAKSAAANAATLLADVRTAKSTAASETEAIAAARKVADDSAGISKGLANKSAIIEARIADYEKKLADLEKQCADQLKEIIGLLPGATSAGLAHAFDERRQTFLKPRNRWQWIFVGSVLAIVGLTVAGLWHVFQAGTPPTYDELARLWLARLPVMIALIWLALHSSHESALAKRLEEDYGYKSVVASSFLGFHKQMSEIGGTVGANPPLAKLCSDTLTTIATPPGRIYDKHALSVSPAGELTQAAKAAADVMSPKRPVPPRIE